jgi:FixJ family two-component response regulator
MGQLLSFAAEIPVYVVDDDLSVREALALLLKIEGYTPQCFGDGASFLEAVRSTPPACVILDLHLGAPDWTSFAISPQRALRRLSSSSPVAPMSPRPSRR